MLQQANIVSQNQKQTRKPDESNRKVQYCILLYCEICENNNFMFMLLLCRQVLL